MLQIIQNPPHKGLELFGHYLMVFKVWMVAATFGFHGLKTEDLDAFFASINFFASTLHLLQAGEH